MQSATVAQVALSFKKKKNKSTSVTFPCLYVLVNITAINSQRPKGRSNVLIQTEVVKPVHDLRAGELGQLSLE